GVAREANPVTRVYLDFGPFWFVFAKCLFIAAPLVGLELLRRRNPRFVKTLARAAIAACLVLYVTGSIRPNTDTAFYSRRTTPRHARGA
ncbi:MAG: DUF5658 family protein, partial [Gammaproteobacteria bacterium]